MTTSNSNSFTPKSVTALLEAWKRQGYTYAQSFKLLKLYCGMSKWMTAEGLYPMAFFYEISKYYHATSTSDFVKKIMKAEGFGYIWEGEEHTPQHLMAFFSPIRYHPHPKSESGMGNIYNINNINRDNNHITKNDIIYHNTHPKSESGMPTSQSGISTSQSELSSKTETGMTTKTETEYDVRAAVKGFLHKICTEDADYKTFVEPLNSATEMMMPELKVVAPVAHPVNMATERYLTHYLAAYFVAQGKNFMSRTYEGQKIWLSRVLEKTPAKRNIERAVNDVRLMLSKNADELRRQYRPISPHEYQDQASGQRFYDIPDAHGNPTPVRIPHDAPPRPSDHHKWDKWLKRWQSV